MTAETNTKPLNAGGSDKMKMLEDRLNDFLARNDWSKHAAGVLEGDLDAFPEGEAEALVADLQHALALYAPGGGVFLYDQEGLEKMIRQALAEIRGTS